MSQNIASLSDALDTTAKLVRVLQSDGVSFADLVRPINDKAARVRLAAFLKAGCPLPSACEQAFSVAIADCLFHWVDPRIERFFTLEPVRPKRTLFPVNCRVDSLEEEGRRIKAKGWNPSNLAELLDYAKLGCLNGGWGGLAGETVFAFGSHAWIDGHRYIPMLDVTVNGRGLGLSLWDRTFGHGDFLASCN